MIRNLFNYERIEHYLSGKLTGKELADFEQALTQDAELVKEVHLHREMQKFLQDGEDEKLKQQLKTLAQKYFSTSSKEVGA